VLADCTKYPQGDAAYELVLVMESGIAGKIRDEAWASCGMSSAAQAAPPTISTSTPT
jgi:hypothetical protein